MRVAIVAVGVVLVATALSVNGQETIAPQCAAGSKLISVVSARAHKQAVAMSHPHPRAARGLCTARLQVAPA